MSERDEWVRLGAAAAKRYLDPVRDGDDHDEFDAGLAEAVIAAVEPLIRAKALEEARKAVRGERLWAPVKDNEGDIAYDAAINDCVAAIDRALATPEPAKYAPCSCPCGCTGTGAAIADGRCAWCAENHKEPAK